MRLSKDFYMETALTAAPALLGKLLCKRAGGEVLKLRITETEAYFGEDDSACHAHRGKTKRTKIMYEEGGVAYVYLCYGIHCLFNVITGEAGLPQGVLIRSVSGFSGPGRLTKAMGIGLDFNGENLVSSDRLWLEDDGFIPAYSKSARIGIEYAKDECKNRPWRFVADIR